MASEILERLDNLENHFKVYKTDMSDVKDSLKEFRLLLGGSPLNGNKGFIKLMETIEEKVDKTQEQVLLMQKDIDNVKFWGRGATGVLFVLVAAIIESLKAKF